MYYNFAATSPIDWTKIVNKQLMILAENQSFARSESQLTWIMHYSKQVEVDLLKSLINYGKYVREVPQCAKSHVTLKDPLESKS